MSKKINITHKDCTKCLVTKSVDEFYSKGSQISAEACC